MVKNWGDVEFEKTNFLLGQKKESLGRKMKILGRKMKPNKRKKIIWTLRFRKKSYFLLSTRIIKITQRNWVHTQIFSSLYFCNLVMVFTFNTFKLKLFDLIDFIGWNIKGYNKSGCKDLGILKHHHSSIPFWSVFYTVIPSKDETLFSCLWCLSK